MMRKKKYENEWDKWKEKYCWESASKLDFQAGHKKDDDNKKKHSQD